MCVYISIKILSDFGKRKSLFKEILCQTLFVLNVKLERENDNPLKGSFSKVVKSDLFGLTEIILRYKDLSILFSIKRIYRFITKQL